jgi:hypothetical protein
MQDHRNGGVPSRPPAHNSLEHRAQRIVLLELVVCPPAEGDSLPELIDRLDLPPHTVEPAVIALEVAGLAQRHGDCVRASLAAGYFEYLWPVRL